MRKTRIIRIKYCTILIVAALTCIIFTSCGDDEDMSNEGGTNSDSSTQYSASPTSIFPEGMKFETYTIETAGQLPLLIPAEKKGLISALKIKGLINGTDLRFIREMAGRDINGEIVDDAALNYLDLSEASIVEGGQNYYKNKYGMYETKEGFLGAYAFYDCKLKAIALPYWLTDIEDSAFYGCDGLKGVYVNCNAVVSSRERMSDVFGSQVEKYVLGDKITSIGDYAFRSCMGLTSINIPNSVTRIGRLAFCDCTRLTSINIPNSVTSIGDGAFECCSGLPSITIPNSVTSIGESAFWGCSGLTSVNIPNSVTSIGAGAFANCKGLTSITIPNSVTSIGKSAFSGCSGLTSINVEKGNTVYDSREDCNSIIETASNTFICGCKNTIIPNSVTSIGDYAFRSCTGLTSINIPNSVTSIGDGAFEYCSGLPSITIPNSVTSIGSSAFSGCTVLNDVIVHWQKPFFIYGYGVFKYTPQENLHIPAGTFDAYKNSGWGVFKNYIEDADNYPIE